MNPSVKDEGLFLSLCQQIQFLVSWIKIDFLNSLFLFLNLFILDFEFIDPSYFTTDKTVHLFVQ